MVSNVGGKLDVQRQRSSGPSCAPATDGRLAATPPTVAAAPDSTERRFTMIVAPCTLRERHAGAARLPPRPESKTLRMTATATQSSRSPGKRQLRTKRTFPAIDARVGPRERSPVGQVGRRRAGRIVTCDGYLGSGFPLGSPALWQGRTWAGGTERFHPAGRWQFCRASGRGDDAGERKRRKADRGRPGIGGSLAGGGRPAAGGARLAAANLGRAAPSGRSVAHPRRPTGSPG